MDLNLFFALLGGLLVLAFIANHLVRYTRVPDVMWFIPRGLITAVLGIEVVETRGSDFAFLPALAFSLILLTNLVLLVGTVRARNLPAENLMASGGATAIATAIAAVPQKSKIR